MKRRRPMTAADFLAQQESDPEYVARRRAQQERVRQQEAELKAVEAPLVDDLRAVGVDVEWSWDLVNRAVPYPEAVPVLLAHLEQSYPDPVREGIARALAVPDARFAWDRLLRLYRDEPSGTRARDGLAVALAAIADDAVVDEVSALLRDVRHGESRILFVSALGRSKTPEARAVLAELQDDPQLRTEIRRGHGGRGGRAVGSGVAMKRWFASATPGQRVTSVLVVVVLCIAFVGTGITAEASTVAAYALGLVIMSVVAALIGLRPPPTRRDRSTVRTIVGVVVVVAAYLLVRELESTLAVHVLVAGALGTLVGGALRMNRYDIEPPKES